MLLRPPQYHTRRGRCYICLHLYVNQIVTLLHRIHRREIKYITRIRGSRTHTEKILLLFIESGAVYLLIWVCLSRVYTAYVTLISYAMVDIHRNRINYSLRGNIRIYDHTQPPRGQHFVCGVEREILCSLIYYREKTTASSRRLLKTHKPYSGYISYSRNYTCGLLWAAGGPRIPQRYQHQLYSPDPSRKPSSSRDLQFSRHV